MRLTTILTLVGLTGSALMAGLFFAYSNSVMGSLERLPDGQGAATMNLLNEEIYNPLFLLIFTGTGLVAVVLSVLPIVQRTPGWWWLVAGSLLYLTGAIITFAVNVPLNEQLAALDPTTSAGAAEWSNFVSSWPAANTIRTITCTIGVVAFGLGLMRFGSAKRPYIPPTPMPVPVHGSAPR